MRDTVSVVIASCVLVLGCTQKDTGRVPPSRESVVVADSQGLGGVATERVAESRRMGQRAQTQDADAIHTRPAPIAYRIAERKMLNDALILSVVSSKNLYDLSTDQLREIAASLVNKERDKYMVRLFFYNPDQTPGRDAALCRFEWTDAQGLKLSYDLSERRVRTPEVLEAENIPAYVVLDSVTMMNGRKLGAVLIPAFSRRTPHLERERAARLIAKTEGFDDLDLYATREAYSADMSESFSRSHPGARQGILGGIHNGQSTWSD
jgi:hypothetical protein